MSIDSDLKLIHVFPTQQSYNLNKGNIKDNELAFVPLDGATINNVNLVGTPKAVTVNKSTKNTQIATTEFVHNLIGTPASMVVIEHSCTSTQWYKKYSNGWVEQGGYVTNIAETKSTAITLPVKMKNTNYFVNVTNASGKTVGDTEGVMCAGTRTTTTVAITCGYINPNTSPCFWEVKGYYA